MIFVFQDKDGSQRQWQPSADDIARWRSRFTGLDVEKQLTGLAQWTWDKWGQKSKRRQLGNAIPWVTKMLERAHEKNEGFSQLSRAREALSQPEWVRRGMTQEQWEKEQQRIWQEKQQHQMELAPPPEPFALEALANVKKMLAEAPPQPEPEFWRPPSMAERMACRHERFTEFSPRQCWHCRSWEHELRSELLI